VLFSQLPEALCYSLVFDYNRSVFDALLFLAITDQVMPWLFLFPARLLVLFLVIGISLDFSI